MPSTFTVDPRVIQQAAARRDRVYPYAVWAPIPEASRQPNITVTTVIAHSMAGPRLTSLEALRAYMARDDVHGESTFVGPDFSGRMFQIVHFDQRADCNYKANPFAVSLETQDEGGATLATTPWSPEQVEQLAGVAAFAHLRDGVPLRPPPSWNAGGVGFHSQYPEWSSYVGKTCPGAARIAQMPAVLARAAEIVAWRPPPPVPEGDDDMMIAIYRPADYRTRPGRAWIAVSGGSCRPATALDVEYADKNGIPVRDITNETEYQNLVRAAGLA